MISRVAKLRRYAALASRQTGKSPLRQLFEMLRLAMGRQRLGVVEYYELEVFDDRYFPCERKFDCVGWRASARIDKELNDDYWRATANDKVLNYGLLAQYGVPHPQTIATYSPAGRHIGRETSLRTDPELQDFLCDAMEFPVFVKPIHGSYGRGTFSLSGHDRTKGGFVDHRGKTIPIQDLVNACHTRQYHGMLFQRSLRPHPKVQAMVGDTISCVRMIIVLAHTGPELHMAFWKIARAHNITDNFCMGESGNMLAWVNKDSGTIERVVTGLWPEGREATQHPDTGQTLLGESLPDWREATVMCLTLAQNFPGLRMQHWDVAFCQDGPVVMELNTEADLGVPQFIGKTPFIDDKLRNILSTQASTALD